MCHPFDTRGEVYLGEDIDPTRDSVSLKYGMYVLSKELDNLFEEYQLHDILRQRMNNRAFRNRIEQGLKQLFSRVFDRITVVCTNRKLRLTRIGLSVPSQWKVETTEIYRSLVESVLPDNSIEMFFVTETEALAHFLCRNYRDLILKQPSPVGNDTILFLDFGGHSMVSCIRQLISYSPMSYANTY